MVGCPEEAAAWRTERPRASRQPQAVDAEGGGEGREEGREEGGGGGTRGDGE